MKYLTIILLISSSLCAPLFAALSDADIIRLMDGKPVEGYDLNPADYGLPATSSGLIILNYDDAVIDGIWRILDNPEQQEHWESAFINFRRITAAEPDKIDFNRLTQKVQSIEQSNRIEDEEKVGLLFLAYGSVARHRNQQAFKFLKARTRFDFWKNNEISRTVYTSGSPGMNQFLETPQTEAIGTLDELQTKEAYLYLKSLLEDSRYAEQPHLLFEIEGSLEHGWESSRRRLQTVQRCYAKRLEIRGEQNTSVAPAVLTATAPGGDTSQTTPPEPLTSTDPEKPAQSWLWLLVAAVGVIGLAWAFKRK